MSKNDLRADPERWKAFVEYRETTEIPYMVHHHYAHGAGKDRMTKTKIADREKGALKKLAAVMKEYPALVAFHQSDPRGVAVCIE